MEARKPQSAAQPLLTTVALAERRRPRFGAFPPASLTSWPTIFHAPATASTSRQSSTASTAVGFRASVSSGLQAAIHCTTATEKDAINLRDTAKGLIGLGRLSVPQDKPDLLRFWDGIAVEQAGRSFTINADIAVAICSISDGPSWTGLRPGGRGVTGGRGGRGGRGGKRPASGWDVF